MAADAGRLLRSPRFAIAILLGVIAAIALVLVSSNVVHAAQLPMVPDPVPTPTDPAGPGGAGGSGGLTVDINGPNGTPSAAILTLLGITLLSVAPALLLMMTSFTKIFVVLAMTRNALALPVDPAEPGARRPRAVPQRCSS